MTHHRGSLEIDRPISESEAIQLRRSAQIPRNAGCGNGGLADC